MLVRWFMLPTVRSLLQLSTAGNACAQTKAAEPAPLTSIAIDPTLFREGAITRLSAHGGPLTEMLVRHIWSCDVLPETMALAVV